MILSMSRIASRWLFVDIIATSFFYIGWWKSLMHLILWAWNIAHAVGGVMMCITYWNAWIIIHSWSFLYYRILIKQLIYTHVLLPVLWIGLYLAGFDVVNDIFYVLLIKRIPSYLELVLGHAVCIKELCVVIKIHI